MALTAINDPVPHQLEMSVQEKPGPSESQLTWLTSVARGPILPAPGTRERQWALRQYYHHDYNELFKGVTAGAIKRVQSTPWEIQAEDADRWQRVLMASDFGSWDRLVAKIVKDFLRYDSGAWIEIIAPGNPLLPPTGPLAGLAALDGLRVYPTGNPSYPAIYYDRGNRMHLLNRARVIQFVDAEDSEEGLAGYGESALSRAIATVHREILMNRYIDTRLDDLPTPGFMTFSNISKKEVEKALGLMKEGQAQDLPDEWGRVVMLYSLDTANKAEVAATTYSVAPEAFDYDTYTTINVRKLALALGTDVAEIWELTAAGLGKGTETEVMAQKSRGKLYGRLMKGLERVINLALPEDAEFAFTYKDPQEDQEEAAKASTYAQTVLSLTGSGVITAQEGREMLANQVPAFQDVLTDEVGVLRRLPDDDPKPVGDPTQGDTPAGPPSPASVQEQVQTALDKSLDATGADFEGRFRTFVQVAQAQRFSGAIIRATFRGELQAAGERAYAQGLRDGGVDPDAAQAVQRAQRRRVVAEWLSVQNAYINKFTDDVAAREFTDKEIQQRGEMWVNKSLRSIYYAGLHEAEGSVMKRWVYDPAKDHCQTCLTLNGQVHSLATWLKSGFTPGCTCLECGGYNCGCKFVDADGGAVGRLPGHGILRTVIDRFTDFVQHIGQVIRPGRGKAWADPWAEADPHTAALAHFLHHQAEA